MIACLDVHYDAHLAAAAAVVFDEWTANAAIAQYSTVVGGSGEYEPGKFYLRELAPLLAVIGQIGEPIDVLVIDAYCYLSDDKLPGLGMHLHAAINQRCSIIGVAKNRYQNSRHADEVLRGG
ncbi:MAG: endonuclease V, partial [Planctomycetia bacterium]|nr:endonuclease V [Planctomycetia bacterium]